MPAQAFQVITENSVRVSAAGAETAKARTVSGSRSPTVRAGEESVVILVEYVSGGTGGRTGHTAPGTSELFGKAEEIREIFSRFVPSSTDTRAATQLTSGTRLVDLAYLQDHVVD
ncbi:hypothetical protein GCM10018955_32390 [Planomonospora venezuelensis]